MKKYKIVYCTPSLYIPGGVERVLTTKVNYFADVLGYDIYIVITDGKGNPPYFELSPKIHIVQLDINFEQLWNRNFLIKTGLYLIKQRLYKIKLTKLLLDIKPDFTISLLRREINFLTSIKDGSKKIGEIHINRKHFRNFEAEDVNFIKSFISKLWNLQLINKLKKLDKFVVLTEDDKLNWKDLKNVVVIPNPLEIKNNISLLENKEIVAVGRYSYEKGFDLLIQAWKIVNEQHKDWILNIYGSGNKEYLAPLIKEEDLISSVIPHDPSKNIFDIYLQNSIFVCSSRFEGFGMVIAEAMSCGLPAISFDCYYGPRNIISNGIDGLLVTNGDIVGLANSIIELIENKNKRKNMGEAARKNIKKFEINIICQKWEKLFNSFYQ